MIMEPLPPSISPYQMDILRIVTAMAWSDGELEPDEVTVMLGQFAQLFAPTIDQRRSLVQELRSYLDQNLPLEDCMKHLRRIEDRRLVLRLSYQVIQASQRTSDEPLINVEEASAYQKLVTLLDLPPAEVAAIETEFSKNLTVAEVAAKLQALINN